MSFASRYELPDGRSIATRAACFTPNDQLIASETLYEHYVENEEQDDELLGYSANDNYDPDDILDLDVYQGGGVIIAGECPCTILSNDNLIDIVPVLQSVPAGGITAQGLGRTADDDTPITWNPAGPGESDTQEIEFISVRGRLVTATITMTQVGAGTGGPIATLSNTTQGGGRIFFANQQREMDVVVDLGCDELGVPLVARMHLHANSIGPTESLVFSPENPVIGFAQGPGGQNISGALPYVGNWQNNNNNAFSGFEFAAANRFAFRKNNTPNAGGGIVLSIGDVPDVISYEPCDIIGLARLDDKAKRLEEVERAVAVPANAPIPAGDFLIGRFEPDGGAVDVANTNIVTGFNLLQAPRMRMKILARDTASSAPWAIAEIDVDSMIARFNAGATPDAFLHVFDNDFVSINVVDPATGELNFTDPGRAMEIAWLELWSSQVAVPLMPLAAATPSGEGNGANQIITLTQDRADPGWTVAGNELRYTGTPDRVRIDATVYYANTFSNAEQRVAPELELLKNGAPYRARGASGYQRHFSNHSTSHNAFSVVDYNPGANPVYSLRSQQGSTQNDAVPIGADVSSFSAEAVQPLGAQPPSAALSEYIARIAPSGFFNTDQGTAQVAVNNVTTAPGPANWEVRFTANFETLAASAGIVTNTDNGNGTFDTAISFTGNAIPGNNGNQQISLNIQRHPTSTDTTATATIIGVF